MDNLDRLAAALRELGAYLRVGGLADDEARALPLVLDGAALARMEISTCRTDAGDLDVLRDLRATDGRRLGYATPWGVDLFGGSPGAAWIRGYLAALVGDGRRLRVLAKRRVGYGLNAMIWSAVTATITPPAAVAWVT